MRLSLFEVCIWKQCVTSPPDPEVLLNNEKYEGVFCFINRKDGQSHKRVSERLSLKELWERERVSRVRKEQNYLGVWTLDVKPEPTCNQVKYLATYQVIPCLMHAWVCCRVVRRFVKCVKKEKGSDFIPPLIHVVLFSKIFLVILVHKVMYEKGVKIIWVCLWSYTPYL